MGLINFISTGIRENILNINKIKTDYGNITDLKKQGAENNGT